MNLLFFAFLVFYALRSAVQVFLNRLNLAYLRKQGREIPDDFKEVVDEEKFRKISAYTIDSSRFEMFSTLADQGFFLFILLSGILPWWVERLTGWGFGFTVSGLLFFGLLGLLPMVLDIPLSLYETFVIENRYGFNTRTFTIWLTDLAKSLILSTLLGGALLLILLLFIIHGGKFWWLIAWVVVSLFELLIMWLYPVLLAPWFNKFDPLENQALVQRIEDLMAKVGLKSGGVFRMDASRRSKHTNAYFTGLGKSKRIVLFDTLLTAHTDEEILSILAHELGHWKKKHILKQIILLTTLSLIGFLIMAQLLDQEIIYRSFAFAQPIPYVGLFLIATLFSPPLFFLQPIEAAFSRRMEKEADDFAADLIKSPEPMILSLKRIASDNLSNLTPHPIYVWFYYSHPPLGERITRLSKKRNL
jgi:STE24 endopeptidase